MSSTSTTKQFDSDSDSDPDTDTDTDVYAEVDTDAIVDRLEDSLKSPYPPTGDVWSALIDTIADEIATIESAREVSRTQKYVTDAEGEALDRVADLFQVERKRDESDSEFRVRLQVVIRAQLTSGTVDEVLEVVSVFLDTSREEIEMIENRANEDAQFTISIPVNKLGEIGLRTGSINSILSDISAAGVSGSSTLKTETSVVPLDYIPVRVNDMPELDTSEVSVDYLDVFTMESNPIEVPVIDLGYGDALDEFIFKNAISSSSLNALSGNNWIDGRYGTTVGDSYGITSSVDPISHSQIGATTGNVVFDLSLNNRQMSLLDTIPINVSLKTLQRIMTQVAEYQLSVASIDADKETITEIGFSSIYTNNLSGGGWEQINDRNTILESHSLSLGVLPVNQQSIGGTTAQITASAGLLLQDMTDLSLSPTIVSPQDTSATTANGSGFSSPNLYVLSTGSWL